MKNHLLIGLGGTGGKILRALRKNMLQESRHNELEVVNLDWLYVDSSKEIMNIDVPVILQNSLKSLMHRYSYANVTDHELQR